MVGDPVQTVALLAPCDIADNYVEPVHGGLEMESNPPYLMYTHGNDEVCMR